MNSALQVGDLRLFAVREYSKESGEVIAELADRRCSLSPDVSQKPQIISLGMRILQYPRFIVNYEKYVDVEGSEIRRPLSASTLSFNFLLPELWNIPPTPIEELPYIFLRRPEDLETYNHLFDRSQDPALHHCIQQLISTTLEYEVDVALECENVLNRFSIVNKLEMKIGTLPSKAHVVYGCMVKPTVPAGVLPENAIAGFSCITDTYWLSFGEVIIVFEIKRDKTKLHNWIHHAGQVWGAIVTHKARVCIVWSSTRWTLITACKHRGTHIFEGHNSVRRVKTLLCLATMVADRLREDAILSRIDDIVVLQENPIQLHWHQNDVRE